MFKIGEILFVEKDIDSDEEGLLYLNKGDKLKVVNVISEDEVHALLLNGPNSFSKSSITYSSEKNGVFGIIKEDIKNGSVVSMSQMRDNKLNQILK